jgi:hypothetical protein
VTFTLDVNATEEDGICQKANGQSFPNLQGKQDLGAKTKKLLINSFIYPEQTGIVGGFARSF